MVHRLVDLLYNAAVVSHGANIMQCPECGTSWTAETSCETYFHQMLFWETENPANWAVHHLTVLCYHLQHPHLYSPDGLSYAQGLLVDFVERGLMPAQIRQQRRETVASGNRAWNITSRAGDTGRYPHPITWTMTAADVVAAGSDAYIESVRHWAELVLADLKASGNLGIEEG